MATLYINDVRCGLIGSERDTMRGSHLEKCLTIIALSIFADSYVHSVETDKFISASQKLPALKNKSVVITDVELLAWYHENKVRLISKTNSEDYKDWLYEQLDSISDKAEQRAILTIMKDISVADHNFHVREQALIMFIARYWDINQSYV